MKFSIQVEFDRKKLRLIVVRIYQNDRLERYEVIARNGSIVLQCNWPILRARGLRHKPPNWELYRGNLKYQSLLEEIIKQVETAVRLQEQK